MSHKISDERVEELLAEFEGMQFHYFEFHEMKAAVLELKEMRAWAAEAREALNLMIEVTEHGDFRNGVSASGIDEGESCAYRTVDRAREVLAKFPREDS